MIMDTAIEEMDFLPMTISTHHKVPVEYIEFEALVIESRPLHPIQLATFR
jgi:hypothetical protein